MNKNIGFYKDLKNIIKQNILDIPIEHIDKMYETWHHNQDSSFAINNFVYDDKFIHKNQNIPENATRKGIDLPSWFGDYNTEGKKIIILGIDPLRSVNSFEYEFQNLTTSQVQNADVNTQVTIGTPYALHEKDTRENRFCIGYWTLVNKLKKEGNFVYCTDIFKTYYHNNSTKTRSYLDKEFVDNSNHREILISEFELINPDLIIIFGKIAHKMLLKRNSPKIGQNILKTKTSVIVNNKSTDVFTIMHLSKGTRGKNFKTFFNSNNIDISSMDVENRKDCAEKYVEMFQKLEII